MVDRAGNRKIGIPGHLGSRWVVLALVVVLWWGRPWPPMGRCVTGVATRHDVMDRVLEAYPGRVVAGVDGYIGVEDCADLGQVYWLRAGRETFLVAAADCLNRAHQEGHEALWDGRWVADIELDLWTRAGLPARLVAVRLCESGSDDRSWNQGEL